MTPMDLHPEDLLEREMRGELSPVEQERLEVHARQCAVCRLERRAREDFRADAEGPDAEQDVARLLAAMAGPLALQGLARAPKASPMRYVRFVSVAAAVVTMTGLAAAAARWPGVRAVVMPWTAESSFVTPPAQAAAARPPAHGSLVAAPAHVAAPEPIVPPEALPAPLVQSVQSVQSAVGERAERARPAPSFPSPALLASRIRPVAPAPAATAAPSPPVDDSGADSATVFHHANDALRSGDHLRAGELYGILLNRYPSSPEAHASLALFGRMLLDDGNANGALQCFDDYLRQGGALREDVMLGRALAFQRIGPRASADEARAWSALIDAYPSSVHAERARRRLSELARL